MIRLYVSDGVQLFQERGSGNPHKYMWYTSNQITRQDLGSCVRYSKSVIIMNHETITFVSPKALNL